MRIPYFCFGLAALSGLTGMALGLYMGLAEDHALAPAHAHLNLLGWVTMTLYGLYHRGAPRTAMVVRWVQVGAGGAGFPAFTGGLAVYLATGNQAVLPVAIAGIVLCILSMVLFLGVLLRDARQMRPLPNHWLDPSQTETFMRG